MTEEIEAAKEIAKTTGKAIDLVKDVGLFFAKAMGESIEATSGMLADTLKYKRWEKQIRLVEKAQQLLNDKGLSQNFRKISPKLAIPIIKNASFEDDDFMHTMWARLLARSMDPAEPASRSSYSDILKQLEPIDVRLLNSMFAIYNKTIREKGILSPNAPKDVPPTSIKIRKKNIIQELSIDSEDYYSAIDNLRRLGLCDSYIEEDSVESQVDGDTTYYDVVSSYGGYDILCITALGIGLVRICTYGGHLPETSA